MLYGRLDSVVPHDGCGWVVQTILHHGHCKLNGSIGFAWTRAGSDSGCWLELSLHKSLHKGQAISGGSTEKGSVWGLH